MDMEHKKGVFEEKLTAYCRGTKKQRGKILDAVVEVTGLKRKQCIKRFRRMQMRDPCAVEPRGRPRYYTPDCIAALKDVWEIGSEACGENLHSQIAEYIDILVRGGLWKHDDVATFKLRKMSEGSVISMVPIRMDGWNEAEAGVIQVDTVAHCGDSVAGDYCVTVNGTDVATFWGSRRCQWNKGQEATQRSLDRMRLKSPFPWTELHPDSGGEFINHLCIGYAAATHLRMTRSRPYHKNDNCFVEERNGHVVRAYVGYDRFDVSAVVDALNDLYHALTPYLNHFIASKRIVSKERIGARWKVTREKRSKTPYQRVLERTDIPDEVKNKLRAEHMALNPRTMKTEIDRLTKRVFDIQRKYGHPRTLSKAA